MSTSNAVQITFLNEEEKKNYINRLIWLSPRIVSCFFFGILFAWIYQAEGGIGGTETNLFGLHALFMSLFVVLFMAEGLLSFSAPLIQPFTKNKTHLKTLHALCHLLGLVSVIVGLVAIILYKQQAPPSDMGGTNGNQYFPFFTLYTPHSWLALAFLGLWLIQLLRRFSAHADVHHKKLGKIIFVMGLAVCALGFQDMQSSDLASSSQPNSMPMGGMDMTGYLPDSALAQYASANVLLLALFGIATFYALELQTGDKSQISPQKLLNDMS